MATNTGKGFRKGSVKNETQVKNPATGDWTKRSHEDGKFMQSAATKTASLWMSKWTASRSKA
jgi:hypothetical protein